MSVLSVFVFLSILFGFGTAYSCTNNIIPTAAQLFNPTPGDFRNVSTEPTGCFSNSGGIACSDISNTVFTDGQFGNETEPVEPTAFHAWDEDSRIALDYTTDEVRQVNLFFYHQPSMGIGLPQFILSVSDSSIIQGDPLEYTILNNQDLSEDDNEVRSVTLAITSKSVENVDSVHMRFELTSEIQQFAVSEIELCSDAATITAETLSVSLQSDPLSGPNILLPANTSMVPDEISLTCTVANQGRFEWQWSTSGSGDVSLGTRSSTITISAGASAVGNYSCTVSYHPDSMLPSSSVTRTFTVELERILTSDETTVYIDDSDTVTLKCQLAGYTEVSSDSTLVGWSFNNDEISSGGKYLITVGDLDCPPYGMCMISQLQITDPSLTDVGNYTCSFENLLQSISLELESPTTPTTPTTPTPTPTTSPPTNPSTTSSSDNSSDLGPIIGGVVGAVLAVVLTLLISISALAVLFFFRKQHNTNAFPSGRRATSAQGALSTPSARNAVEMGENCDYVNEGMGPSDIPVQENTCYATTVHEDEPPRVYDRII